MPTVPALAETAPLPLSVEVEFGAELLCVELDAAGVPDGAEAPDEEEPEGALDDVWLDDVPDEPAGADDVVLLAKLSAACWNAAKDFSSVGLIAKTIPDWQWFKGL